MPEIIDRRVSFNAGEWSPWTDPRLDLDKYRSACRVMENFRPAVYGGAFRRGGTIMLAPAEDSEARAHLVAFEFNAETTLVLEFGEKILRFWTTGTQAGLVEDPLNPGDPYEVVTPWTAAEVQAIQVAQLNDILIITHPAHAPYELSRLSATNGSWLLREVPIEWPALLDMNLTATTLAVAATTGTSIGLTASTSIFQPGHAGSLWVIRHRRDDPSVDLAVAAAAAATSNPLFVLGDWSASVEVSTGGTWESKAVIQRSYDGVNWETLRTIISSGLSSGTVTGTELEPAFLRLQKVSDSGTPPGGNFTIQAVDPDQYGLVRIKSVGSGTAATVDILVAINSTAPTTRWQEAAWSGVRGYPRAVTFHDQRLFFGGTLDQPQSVWGSVIDDFYNFRAGSDDDLALALTLASNASNAVQWLLSQESLIIGTAGAEWVLGSRDATRTLTPGNAAVKRQTNYGSNYLPALSIQDATLFLQRGGRRLREFVYAFEKDGFSAQDMTLLAEHVTAGGIIQMAAQRAPESIVWCVTGDGDLLGLTYERGQNVAGWFRYKTAGRYESVAVVSGGGETDEVWVSVLREIDEEEVRFIERFQPDLMERLQERDQAGLCYLDCAAIIEPDDPADVIDGLDHLEGMEVSILADGSPHPNRTVLGGEIQLQFEAEKVIAGLPYVSTLSPTYLETSDPGSVTKAGKKRLHRAVVEVWRTLGVEYSGDGEVWDRIEFRTPGDLMDASPPLADGIVEMYVDALSERQTTLTLRQRQPLPCNILSLTTRYEVGML